MIRSVGVCVFAGMILSGCDVCSSSGLPEYDTAGAEHQVVERLQALRQVVVAHPDSVPAWGLLALSLQAHDYPEAAVQAYARARSRRPETFAYVYLPAILLADRGRSEASELFERARALRPEYVPLRLREAAWQLDLGQPQRAIDLLDDSIVMSTTPARAILIMARAALAQNRLDRTRELLDAGIRAAPRYGALYALSGQLYRQVGEPELAELEALRAQTFRGEPNLEDPVLATLYVEGISSRWHILKGQGNLAAGRLEDARAAFEQAVAARPSDAHARNQLGIALQALGQFDEAADSYRRALDLRPGFAEATSNLAMSLFSSGEQEAGINAARQAIESDPTGAQGYLYLGMFEQAMGRPDRARGIYAQGLSIGMFDVRIGIRLAWILATSRSPSIRDGRRAVVLAETVNEIEGYDQPASLDALAAAYAEYRVFDRALATAARAQELAVQQGEPGLAAAIEWRGTLYTQHRAYRE